jgi:hypothetical protein
MKYIVIQYCDLEKLIVEVNEKLAKGATLVGGISYDKAHYIQAMLES